jgi:hypothetical protein
MFPFYIINNRRLYREQLSQNGNQTKLPTVKQMLDDRRKEHIDQFIQTEKTLNEAFLVKQQLKEIQTAWQNRDKQTLNRDPNLKGRLSKMYALIEKEMEFVATCAAREVLETRVEELTRIRDQRSVIMGTLTAKKQQIQKLDSAIEHRQRLIETLSYDNSETRRNILRQKNDTLDAIEKYIAHYRDTIPIKVSFVQGFYERELALFNKANFASLLHTQVQDTRVQDRWLSINGFKIADELREAANVLQYPTYKTTESFVSHISQLQRERLSSESSRRRVQDAMTYASNSPALKQCSVERVEKIAEACKQLEKEQHEVWLPACQATVRECQQGVEECERVRRLGDDWFTLPANNIDWEGLVQNRNQLI